MNLQTMKKIFISILAASALFAGCNAVLIEEANNGYGELALDLSASDQFETISKASETRAGHRNEDVNEFHVKMTRVADGLVKEYRKFGEMPQMVQLSSGKWTLKVSSPDTLPAAFDQPIYGARHEFDIKVGEVSSEKLVCTLQNIKVSFNLEEAFTNELKNYTITVSNGEGAANTLYWTNVVSEVEDQTTTKDMTKAGYFKPASSASSSRIIIRVDATRKFDGSEAYHEISLNDVNARDHIVVKLGAKVTGQAGFQLTIDPTVNSRDEEATVPGFDEDPVEDEWDDLPSGGGNGDSGNDDGGSGDGSDDGSGDVTENPITLNWPANPTLAKTNITNGMQVVMNVHAPAGIEDFIVTIKSQSQTFMSTCSMMTSNPQTAGNIQSVEIDLINDSVAVERMGGLGLTTGEGLYHKTTPIEFNISKLVPMIPTQGPVYGSDYLFNLSVTDVNGVSNDWDLVFHLPQK